jgi:hypothetical protein
MDATERRGHEVRDVSMRWMAISGVILVLLLAGAFVTMRWAFDLLAARAAGSQPEPATLVAGSGPAGPPEPRLQANPRLELREARAGEDAILSTYGWSDREKGIARMPIEEAMRIAVERGLPARSGPADGAGGDRDQEP